MTLITAISVYGDSTVPLFISKNKTFDKVFLAAQQLFEGHSYAMRTAEKNTTEVLFIDYFQNVSLPRVSHLREKTKYQGKTVLILDGHATHITPRVVTYAGSQGLSLIRLVPYSSHVAQPRTLCVFGLLKTIDYKERKFQSMKGKTRKMYHAPVVFYKATMIPMVRSGFEKAGFLLDLENIRNPVQIVPSRVLDRIGVPDFEIDDSLIYLDHMRKEAEAKDAARKRTPTPKPSEFAINWAGLHPDNNRSISSVWSQGREASQQRRGK
jgi:hypothetical protein